MTGAAPPPRPPRRQRPRAHARGDLKDLRRRVLVARRLLLLLPLLLALVRELSRGELVLDRVDVRQVLVEGATSAVVHFRWTIRHADQAEPVSSERQTCLAVGNHAYRK